MHPKLFLSSLFLASALLAEEGSLFSYQLGYSSNSITHTCSTNTGGFYNGIDMMKTTPSGFGFGAGFDLNVWDAPSQNGTNNTMYSMAGTAKLGYTFQNNYSLPLKLKAGIGYGIIKSVDDSGWGFQYEAGGEYLLYKSLGIGVKYKYAQADLLGTTFKNDSTIFMMIFGY